VEAFAQQVVAVLGAGDLDILRQGGAHFEVGLILDADGFVEAGGEEAAFEAGGAEDGLLGEGHALKGKELLGVDGLVDGDEVFLEAGDLLEVFETDDSKGRGGEAVLDGVLCGACLALGGLGAGGVGGIGSIGGELFGGGGFFCASHGVSDLSFTMRRERYLTSIGVSG